jgi:hypothetical protein
LKSNIQGQQNSASNGFSNNNKISNKNLRDNQNNLKEYGMSIITGGAKPNSQITTGGGPVDPAATSMSGGGN